MARQPWVKFALSDPPPIADANEVAQWAAEQFRILESYVEAIALGFLEETHVEPAKLYTGLIRLADGTNWDPGFGRGPYWYDEGDSSWHPMF